MKIRTYITKLGHGSRQLNVLYRTLEHYTWEIIGIVGLYMYDAWSVIWGHLLVQVYTNVLSSHSTTH